MNPNDIACIQGLPHSGADCRPGMHEGPNKVPPTDEDLIEQQAQEQLAETIDYLRKRHLAAATRARYDELVKEAGLPPPASDSDVVANLTGQVFDNLKKKHLESLAIKAGNAQFESWLTSQK